MASPITPFDYEKPDWLGDLGSPDPGKVARHMAAKTAVLLAASPDHNGRLPGDPNFIPPAA